jgi:hypothetical protein
MLPSEDAVNGVQRQAHEEDSRNEQRQPTLCGQPDNQAPEAMTRGQPSQSPTQLWQWAGYVRRKAQLTYVVAQEMQAAAQRTCQAHLRQQHEIRERRACERLRPLMPGANAWTIELTAQILVARGLDQEMGRRHRSGGRAARGSPP